MIQAEIKVNGALIGVVTCTNKGPGTCTTSYQVVLHDLEGCGHQSRMISHDPNKGYRVLMAKAFEAVR